MQSATPLDTITVQAEADAALTPPASQLPTPAAPSLAGDTDPAHASLWDRIMAAETHIAALVPAVNPLAVKTAASLIVDGSRHERSKSHHSL